ncbi:MAG: peptide-methionine (S)-S-oxide reductase MsrA [Methanosarcinaceae archaeon]|nr:peptide-methionine (S)-S-oxide reductase MsrA [Methanosarcinaceae archaeon]
MNETAYFASGCFWGTEYWFIKNSGVLETEAGYMGGNLENPTYEDVMTGNTGHVEAVRVVFNPEITSYESLVKLFFETHDFTQKNGQGPDLGSQYFSKIFYTTPEQKEVAEKIVFLLEKRGFDVTTEILPESKFWPAEEYHQKYFIRNQKQPYCHFRTVLF